MSYDFYRPGESWLHTLHPAAKLLVFGAMVSLLPFAITGLPGLLALFAALVAAAATARIPARRFLLFSPVLLFVAVSWLTWLFDDRGGKTLFEVDLGPVGAAVTQGSLDASVTFTLRILTWGLAYALILFTTSNRDLVLGFRTLGVPHTAAVTVGMTLKFLTQIAADARAVVEAQRCRGLGLRGRGFFERLRRRYLMAVVPSVFALLKRFRTMSYALSIRAFGAPTEKTQFYRLAARPKDYAITLGFVVFGATIVALDRFGPWGLP